MTIRFRYGLKEIFFATTLLAMLAATFFWWRWWNYTHHMRDLCKAVSASALDADTKLIMEQLAWSSKAWDSGLIRDLAGPISIKRVVWKGRTKSGCDIYIFDAFIRPAADTPVPPVCVVFNRKRNELAWETVAPFSSGFLKASLDNHDVLTITTVANWFAGKGVYKYTIGCHSITAKDDGNFVKFDNEDHAEKIPKLMSKDPALDDAIEQIKKRVN